MRVKIDRGACQGNGRCAEAAPSLYELDDLGNNVGGEFTITEEQAEDAFRGASLCPERAIRVYFDD